MARITTDQAGRQVRLPEQAKRIVSLVPSQTELLFDLGLRDEVVGITKFCIHPESWFREKPRIGGTKQIHHDRIEELQPDLIIANKEENTKADVAALASTYPVWVSDVRTIPQALDMMVSIGDLVGKAATAKRLAAEIKAGLHDWPHLHGKPIAYLIWQNPWMGVGADTFIHDVIETLGATNVLRDLDRYPVISLQQLAEKAPEEVWLSSEPFPFGPKHLEPLKKILPNTRFRFVDGAVFSWYGSRMQYMSAHFNQCFSA